jgi:hypothetical protein
MRLLRLHVLRSQSFGIRRRVVKIDSNRIAQIFQKSESGPEILRARRVIWNKFHTKDLQTLSATV